MLKRIKTNVITSVIIGLCIICFSPISEVMALSNKFDNDVKRKVRGKYQYNKEHWIELKCWD